MAHMTSKGRNDPEESSAKFGTRMGAIHMHVDDTWKFLCLLRRTRGWKCCYHPKSQIFRVYPN